MSFPLILEPSWAKAVLRSHCSCEPNICRKGGNHFYQPVDLQAFPCFHVQTPRDKASVQLLRCLLHSPGHLPLHCPHSAKPDSHNKLPNGPRPTTNWERNIHIYTHSASDWWEPGPLPGFKKFLLVISLGIFYEPQDL